MKGGNAAGWEPVYRVVRRIPAGRVASYGQIAALAGMPRAARQVGYALHALAFDSDVPWHRVVNAAGRISARGPSAVEGLQRARLEAEGIGFDAGGRIDWTRFGWRPRASAATRAPAARKQASNRTAAVRRSRGNRK
ncbi:MAG: MGMT family protein [Myxococcota bacterium]